MKPRYVWVIVLATLLVGMFAGGTVLALTAAAPNEIFGTPRDDILTGTRSMDAILAKGGDDTLRGLRGSDALYGNRGNDKIVGGYGQDSFYGGPGKDRIFSVEKSGATWDWVDCGDGYDYVRADSKDEVAGNCENVSRVGP
jgi:Ca2+-binding RTX toxin-like protein